MNTSNTSILIANYPYLHKFEITWTPPKYSQHNQVHHIWDIKDDSSKRPPPAVNTRISQYIYKLNWIISRGGNETSLSGTMELALIRTATTDQIFSRTLAKTLLKPGGSSGCAGTPTGTPMILVIQHFFCPDRGNTLLLLFSLFRSNSLSLSHSLYLTVYRYS